MKKVAVWLATGAALLLGSAVASPLAAQCMACTGSTSCGSSATRGNCSVNCVGTSCACSDSPCDPQITTAPVGTEHAPLFAASDGWKTQGGAVALLTRSCDGSSEFLVLSADGTQLARASLAAPVTEPLRLLGAARMDTGNPGTGMFDPAVAAIGMDSARGEGDEGEEARQRWYLPGDAPVGPARARRLFPEGEV